VTGLLRVYANPLSALAAVGIYGSTAFWTQKQLESRDKRFASSLDSFKKDLGSSLDSLEKILDTFLEQQSK